MPRGAVLPPARSTSPRLSWRRSMPPALEKAIDRGIITLPKGRAGFCRGQGSLLLGQVDQGPAGQRERKEMMAVAAENSDSSVSMVLQHSCPCRHTLPPDRPDQPLRISVLPRRPRGCGAIADAHGAKHAFRRNEINGLALHFKETSNIRPWRPSRWKHQARQASAFRSRAWMGRGTSAGGSRKTSCRVPSAPIALSLRVP